MRAVIGGVCALIAVLVAVLLVMVASAESDATPAPPVVLVPHGAAPTIYAGPGARAQLNGLWRFRRDQDNIGLEKGFQAGSSAASSCACRTCRTRRRSAAGAGIPIFRGTVGWYRTKVDVPVDGVYAIRFESVNHRAQVFIDGKRVAEHKGEYLPFDVRVPSRPAPATASSCAPTGAGRPR